MSNEGGERHCHQCGRALEDVRYCPDCGADQKMNDANPDKASETGTTDRMRHIFNRVSINDRRITFGRIIAWIIAPLIILSGIAMLITDPVAGLIFLFIGIFALPITRNRIHEKHNIVFSRWIVLGVVIMGLAVAGGFIDSENAGPGEADESEAANAEAEAAETEDEETDSGDGAADEDEGLQVRILYDGDWEGAVGEEGSTRSVEGSGENTLDVADNAMIVSATIQKQDATDDELTVQILEDGEVVEEEATTAEYGVVSITSGL